MKGEFSNLHIIIGNSFDNGEEGVDINQTRESLHKHELDLEVLDLKDNVIQRGLVPLEELISMMWLLNLKYYLLRLRWKIVT